MKRNCLLLLLAWTVSGCGDDPTDPEEPIPVTISPAQAWAGGVVRLAPFQAGPDSARIFLGEARLPVVSTELAAVSVRLPDTVQGSLVLRADSPSGRVLGSVEVSGVVSYSPLPAHFGSEVWPAPWPGSASVLVGAENPRRVLRYWPGNGTEQLVAEGLVMDDYEVRAPGRTPDPDVLLFSSWAQPLSFRWRVHPDVQLLDTVRVGFSRHGAMLRNGLVVATTGRGVATQLPGEQGYRFQDVFSGSTGIHLSPDGGLALVAGGGGSAGSPVFDTTGLPRYRVAAYMSSGAFFTPGGDTLFVGGSPGSYRTTGAFLYVVAAASGAELERVDLGRNWMVDAVAADPNGRWLYVALSETGEVAEIVVVDRATLETVGRLRLAGLDCTSICWVQQIATGNDGLYAFTADAVVKYSNH